MLALVTGEISCLIFAHYSHDVSTILYVLTGIAIGIIPLLQASRIRANSFDTRYARYTYLLYIAAILIISNWSINVFRAHIFTTPLDVRMGDMMLFIREMSVRYITDRPVYEPITSIYGYPVEAVYLPAFWLPYAVPISVGADMRWASLAAFIIAVLINTLLKRNRFTSSQLLLLIPLVALMNLLLGGAAYYLMHTQEALVLSYVSLLAWALIDERWILAGIAASLCIMSRYFLAAPLLAGLIWLFIVDRRAFAKAIIATLLSLMILLTISRSWGDIGHFLRIPILYATMLHEGFLPEAFKSVLFYSSVGFAAFLHGDSVRYLSAVNLSCLILIPAVYFLIACRYLSGRPKGLIILCGLKIFLVLFLTTLSRPYGYVLYTASLVSIMLLRAVLIHASGNEKKTAII